ncbi:MAG: hypothetical protein ABIR78_08750 [Ferruginibacter sp.]
MAYLCQLILLLLWRCQFIHTPTGTLLYEPENFAYAAAGLMINADSTGKEPSTKTNSKPAQTSAVGDTSTTLSKPDDGACCCRSGCDKYANTHGLSPGSDGIGPCL